MMVMWDLPMYSAFLWLGTIPSNVNFSRGGKRLDPLRSPPFAYHNRGETPKESE
jgi:hypothetical protein